jgi:hypothetical protein
MKWPAKVFLAVAVLVARGVTGLSRARRLERVLEDHDRAEADLEAMVNATREPASWERRETCGCYWLAPGAPEADPVWVPCDDHAETLLRAIEAGEDL